MLVLYLGRIMMTRMSPRLAALLDHENVPFRRLPHVADITAQSTAEHTHTRGRRFAKTVIVWVDGQYAMAVIPAHRYVDLEKVRNWLNAEKVRLATEYEMVRLFPDCELGAEPPFGNLYELPVYVSPLLSRDRISFHGGNHEEAIEIDYSDFAAIVKPSVIDVVAD
jgi:Ala-tRNA(Pro) deacylase